MDTKKRQRGMTLAEALKGINLCELSRHSGMSRSNIGRWRTKNQGIRRKYIPMIENYLKMEFIGYNKKNEPLFKCLA